MLTTNQDIQGTLAAGVTTIRGGLAVSALSTPVNDTHVTSPGVFGGIQGTLGAGTYYYRVAATNATGTTLASTETSIVIPSLSTNYVMVKWLPVTGATGYKVYGRATGAELLIATITNGTQTFWLDLGSVTPSGALPTANTSAGNVASVGTITMGAGTTNVTSASTAVGTIYKSITIVSSGADTTEDTLMTYTLPGGSMDTNGMGVRVTICGDGVSTADVTTVKCYFGATAVLTKILTAAQANTWRAEYEVMRTAATTQIAGGTLTNGGTVVSSVQSNSTPAETLSGNIVIKCTGQRATSSVASSVRAIYMIVEFFN